jgi:phosphoserine phosphatase
MQPTAVLATLSGRDRPGVTASFFAALAAYDTDVRDVEQVVIRDRLMLAVLFDLRGDPAALRASLGRAAAALGMDSEVVVAEHQPSDGRDDDSAPSHVEGAAGTRTQVLLLGRTLRAGALGHVAQHIADHSGNIESIVRVAEHPAPCLELMVRTVDPARLRAGLVSAATDIGLDVAVQADGLQRCAKRLVMLDVGATLLLDDDETAVELLSERAGVAGQSREIAARQAAGELSRDAAVRAQAQLLAGVSESVVVDVSAEARLRPDARAFTRALRGRGYTVGAVDDGFGLLAERLRDELDIDHVATNRLEISDGRVTGRLLDPVIDATGKGTALSEFAARQAVPLAQAVAVGSGRGDIEMLQTAGLGIACTGATATADGPASWFDSVLFVLGVGEDAAWQAATAR